MFCSALRPHPCGSWDSSPGVRAFTELLRQARQCRGLSTEVSRPPGRPHPSLGLLPVGCPPPQAPPPPAGPALPGLPPLRPPRFQLLVRPCLVLAASDLGFSTRQLGGQPAVHIHRHGSFQAAQQPKPGAASPSPPSSTRLRSRIPTLRNLQHCWAPLCFSWSFPPSSLQGVLKQAPMSSTEEEARHAHLSPPAPLGLLLS